jgi:hypothetical protein
MVTQFQNYDPNSKDVVAITGIAEDGKKRKSTSKLLKRASLKVLSDFVLE